MSDIKSTTLEFNGLCLVPKGDSFTSLVERAPEPREDGTMPSPKAPKTYVLDGTYLRVFPADVPELVAAAQTGCVPVMIEKTTLPANEKYPKETIRINLRFAGTGVRTVEGENLLAGR